MIQRRAQVVQHVTSFGSGLEYFIRAHVVALAQGPYNRTAGTRRAIGQNGARTAFGQFPLQGNIAGCHGLVGQFQNLILHPCRKNSLTDCIRLHVGRNFGIGAVTDDLNETCSGDGWYILDRDLGRDGIAGGYWSNLHGNCLGRVCGSVQLHTKPGRRNHSREHRGKKHDSAKTPIGDGRDGWPRAEPG